MKPLIKSSILFVVLAIIAFTSQSSAQMMKLRFDPTASRMSDLYSDQDDIQLNDEDDEEIKFLAAELKDAKEAVHNKTHHDTKK